MSSAGRFFYFLLLVSCQSVVPKEHKQLQAYLEYSNNEIPAAKFGITPNSIYEIKDTIDLQGQTLKLPQGVTILNNKGGVFRNGCIIGNNTVIKKKTALFDRVRIKGTWCVTQISTSLFVNLDYENSLKDVLALTNPSIENFVYINRGIYYVSALKYDDAILTLNSNTKIIIDGEIILRPNSYPKYKIFLAEGENVLIKGHGVIKGDRNEHLDNEGEWGMGIYISGKNVMVKDVSIKDCWGDCIYVKTRSHGIVIDGCKLSNSRRQGISVTLAKDVTIKNCEIYNVAGTAPEYGIDIEPNRRDTIERVIIDNVKVVNCKGGIMSYGKADSSMIDYILINNSIIKNADKIPLLFRATNEVVLKKCEVDDCKGAVGIAFQEIDKGSILKNTLSMNPDIVDIVKKKIKGKEKIKGVELIDCGNIQVKE